MAFRAARATLHFPREDVPNERPSARSLDSVGAMKVLGAMVEQRRRSQPPPPLDLDLESDLDADAEEADVDASADESQERAIGPVGRKREEKRSIGFIKIR